MKHLFSISYLLLRSAYSIFKLNYLAPGKPVLVLIPVSIR